MATRGLRRWTAAPVVLAALAALAVFDGGCAEKITGTGPAESVTVNVDLKAGPAVSFRLIVTAADMDTVRALMAPVNDRVTAALQIPAGPDRRFLAEALDLTGIVLYRGETVRNVTSLLPLDLTIDMRPAAPMIYLIPHFANVRAGDPFTLTVCVNDLVGLTNVGFGISLRAASQDGKAYDAAYVDTVLIDADQALYGGSLVISRYGPADFYLNVFNEGTIVDEDGDACLVTLYCRSDAGWLPNPDVLIAEMYLEYTSGTEINDVDIHIDGARLRLGGDQPRAIYLGTANNDAGAALAPAGGDVVVAGSIQTMVSGIYGLFLARLAPDATSRWQTSISWGGPELTSGLARATDGGYFVTGSPSFGPGIVLKVTADGVEDWRRPLDEFGGGAPRAVAARPGGGCVVAGTWPSDGDHFYVAVLDADGNVTYDAPADYSANQVFTSVVTLDDATFVAAGNQTQVSGSVDGIVLGRYSLGDGIGRDWLQPLEHAGYTYAYDLLATAGGGFLIVGQTSASVAGRYDICAIRTDAGGAQLWSRTFGTPGDDIGVAVVASPDGGFVIAGTTNLGEDPRDILVAKLNAGGEVVWQRTHGGPSDESARDIIRAGDGYLVTGVTDNGPNGGQDVMMLRIDANGR